MRRLPPAPRRPFLSRPVNALRRRLRRLPSHHTSPSGSNAHSYKSYRALIDRHRVRIRLLIRPRQHAEIAELRIDRPQPPVLSSTHIQTMSSPTVVIFHPWRLYFSGGISIAKFVFPQALGNAAATYVFSHSATSRRSAACAPPSTPAGSPENWRSAAPGHFFPSSAFPPYPLPNSRSYYPAGNGRYTAASDRNPPPRAIRA
jgi:hypothetical protein